MIVRRLLGGGGGGGQKESNVSLARRSSLFSRHLASETSKTRKSHEVSLPRRSGGGWLEVGVRQRWRHRSLSHATPPAGTTGAPAR
jgi:hypothetical protein